MAEDLINSLINRPNAKKEITETISDLELLQKQLADTASSAIVLNTALGKSTNAKDLTANVAAVNKELEKGVKIRERMRQTIISNSQAEVDAYEKAKQGEAGITETVNKRNRAEAQAANEATARSAKALGQQQKQAAEYIRAQGLIEKLTAKQKFYQTAAQQATDPRVLEIYNRKLQSTEVLIKQLGNVGKDGFDSLGNAVKKSGNAFQQIGAKVVTLARLLPGIGIIGLIAFATDPLIEYIAQLDIFKKKAEEIISVTAIDSSDFKNALSAVNSLKTSISEFNDGQITGKQLVDRYNESIGQTAGILTTTTEVETFYNSKASAYVQAMFLRSKANAALEVSANKLAEAQKRAIEGPTFGDKFKAAIKRFGSSTEFDADVNVKFAANVAKAQADAVEKLNKEGEKGFQLFDKLKKESDAFNKANGFGDLDGAKREQERLKAEQDAKKRAEEAKRRAKELQDIARASAKELLDLQNDYEKQLADAKARGEKAEEERLKNILKNSESVFEQANSQRLLQIEKDKSDVLNALAEQYAQGLISTEQYTQQKQAIENQSGLESIDSAIKLAQQLIQIRADFGEDTSSEEEKLAKLQIQYSAMVRDAKLADLEKVKGAQKALNDNIKALASEAITFLATLVGAGFESEKNRVEEQKIALEDRTKNEIDAVERSVGSEKEKADRISIINAKAAAEKEQLNRKQKQIDIEKAKFDKLVSAARVIQAVGIAEVEALTYLSNPFTAPFYPAIAATIAALGALQLATIIATPIPTYKDGTDNHKGGWAIFGEAGTEYVKEPGKAGYLTEGATLGKLAAGTQVISNADLMSAMANPNSGGDYVTNQLNLSELLQQNERHNKGIIKALEVKQSANYLRGRRDEKKFNEYLKRNIN